MKNSKRELLLAALLTHATIREAAASVGIPETTAYNHLRDPDFTQEYNQRKRDALAETSSFLRSRINEASQIVCNIMRDGKASARARLDACKIILEYGFKAAEQEEIIQRIAALETQMEDSGR